ncbi:MAG: doubled domain protein [Bacillales bacterium]|jgi:predicted CXXCH cytochrome family protein|nr:doubled domain protein [Bacillales bacterium]
MLRVNKLLNKKEKTEKGFREEKGMKGLLTKTLVTTALLIGAFTGSALAYQNKANQSNETGQLGTAGTLVKSLKGQQTHTNFQENTNSCASCHMTHTANAKQLLFGSSTQATCLACHDGSLGFYNVKTGELYTHNAGAELVEIDSSFPTITTADVVASNAGSFDRTVQDASMHNVDTHKSLGVKAAPGGNYTGAAQEDTNGEDGKWGDEFSCASCHAPHGSYSDRLLHYNPNGMGTVDVKERGFGLLNNPTVATTEQTLGYTVEAYNVLLNGTDNGNGTSSSTAPTLYKVIRGTVADHKTAAGSALPASVSAQFATLSTTEQVIVVYKAKEDSYSSTGYAYPYEPDFTPWLNSAEYPYNFEHQMMFTDASITVAAYDLNGDGILNNTEVTDADHNGTLSTTEKGNVATRGLTPRSEGVNYAYAYGFVSGAVLADVDSMRIPRVSVVDLDLVQVATYLPDVKDIPLYVSSNAALTNGDLDANGDILAAGGSKSGKGVQFSRFCAACHVDYLASSGAPTGHYNNNTGTSMTCNSCHTGTVTASGADMSDDVLDNGKFRHTTNSDNYSCTRCHMSHGSNALLFKDSKGADYAYLTSVAGGSLTPGAALAHLDDINPSSAIKRYTNMSVCWGCHTSSHASQLVNNDEYQMDSTKQVGLKYGTWDANKSWTAGNRWGFGKPAATPALTAIEMIAAGATSANSGKYDDFYPSTGVLDVYPSGGNPKVKTLVLEFVSYPLLTTADKYASLGADAKVGGTAANADTYFQVTDVDSGLPVGNLVFDDTAKHVTVELDREYEVGPDTNTFTFTIAGKLYTINFLAVKPS